jgi:outer membrane protein assembly factor BamA
VLFIILPIAAESVENIFVTKIDVNRLDPFASDSIPLKWYEKIANKLHYTTRPIIIRKEILFSENEVTSIELIEETERNLRTLGIFTKVSIELDSIGYGEYNAKISTQDGWSTMPTPWLSSGGGATNYGGEIEENNLLGTGTKIKAKALYRNESDIGWEGTFVLYNSRFPGTALQDSIAIVTNKLRTTQKAILQIPYRTLSSRYSTGLIYQNNFGKDFYYRNSDDYDLINLKYKSLDFWYSRSFWDNDRLFVTALASTNNVTRHNDNFRQAFDNSGYVLLNFASLGQDFDIVKNVNTFLDEDLIYGGYGSATIGKVFPMTSDGDNLYYVAGVAEKSFYKSGTYLFLRLAGSSGFDKVISPRYTYQESYVNFYKKLSERFTLASRISEQTVWNWRAFRQLILDNDNGLRGVPLNALRGDSRMFFNTELRYFIDKEFLIFKYSLAAFFDIGTVWNQEKQIWDAHFQKSAGLGFRLHFAKSRNPSHTWRFDFPYNFETKKLGFVFTTKQFFPAFTNHNYTIPQILGRALDFD